MARPTEEDLGIAPTAEEMAEQNAPRPIDQDDDIPQRDDEDDITQVAAPKKPEDEETPAEKAQRARDEATGKFVKADEARPPQEGVKPPPGFVDQRALREERQARQLLEERLNTLMEVVGKRMPQPAAETPPPPIDKNADPMGYIDTLEARLATIEGESAAQAKQRQQAESEQADVNRALSVAQPQFMEAAAADPTITTTYNELLSSLAREIAFVNGIPTNGTITPAQREFVGKELTKLENGHIRFAVAQGRNVAEYMREFAATRGINGAAQQQPVADTATGQPVPARTIQERQQAQQRHMSLGDLPGNAVPSAITAKDIARMTPAQFKAYAKSVGEDGLDMLMGKG